MRTSQQELVHQISKGKALDRAAFEDFFKEEILEALEDSMFSFDRIIEAKKSAWEAWKSGDLNRLYQIQLN